MSSKFYETLEQCEAVWSNRLRCLQSAKDREIVKTGRLAYIEGMLAGLERAVTALESSGRTPGAKIVAKDLVTVVRPFLERETALLNKPREEAITDDTKE